MEAPLSKGEHRRPIHCADRLDVRGHVALRITRKEQFKVLHGTHELSDGSLAARRRWREWIGVVLQGGDCPVAGLAGDPFAFGRRVPPASRHVTYAAGKLTSAKPIARFNRND